MSQSVIRVENLGKKYTIGKQKQEKYTALRDVIADGVKSFRQKFTNSSSQANSNQEEFWALKDVSLEINQGDRVGIIGRNGAGKSTLLKVLSRITEPTTGRIILRGRVASLLEVGTGFHPELTGRENIFLNGAILGMTKVEIKKKFDEIVAFAEVEKFLDTPVKRYSSGMYVRLAFAVAAHLEPEILIVDEVLAVGDAQFQKKCLGKMKQVGNEGRTVLFVSHNFAAINTLCDRGIVLKQGETLYQGNIQKCIDTYQIESDGNQQLKWLRSANSHQGKLIFTKIEASLEGKQPNLKLNLQVVLNSITSHHPAFLAIDIADISGTVIMQAIPILEGFLKYTQKEHFLSISIQLPPMIPGQYLVTFWTGIHNTKTLDEVKDIILFEITNSPTVGRSFPHTKNHGYIVPKSNLKIKSLDRKHSCI